MEYKDEDILRILTQKNPEDLIEIRDKHVQHTKFRFNLDKQKLNFNNFDLSVDKLYDNHFNNFYFQLITFKNCSFKGMKFTNMFFLGCHFINCNFQDCNLNQVTFNLCSFNNLSNISPKIESVLFNNCTLNAGDVYFDLQNLNFIFCGFKNCTINKIDFSNSTFNECFFNGGEVFKNIDNSIFKNCEFIISTFENLHFTNILFDNTKFIAQFHNVTFDYGNSLNNCEFNVMKYSNGVVEQECFKNVLFNNMPQLEHRNVQFKGGNKIEETLIFNNVKIIDTNFPNSYFYNIIFDSDEHIYHNNDCEIKGSQISNRKLNFQNSIFKNVHLQLLSGFELIDFTGTTFSDCEMPLTNSNIIFEECNFENTNIENILDEDNDNQVTPYFIYCSFRGSNMSNMIFINTEFERCVFSAEGTILENSIFRECLFHTVVFSHKATQRHPSSTALIKNVSFVDSEFINCLMQNEINNIDFSGSNLLKTEFDNNSIFNQASYRENNKIITNNDTILPEENFKYEYMFPEENVDILRLQEQRLMKKVKEIIKDDYENEIDDFEGTIGNRVFPTQDGVTYSIFDIINGDIEITPTFFQDNPTYRLICRIQENNLFPYIIDLDVLDKFNNEIQNDLNSEYLGNIIFECDRLYSMEEVTDDDNILNTEPFVNMKVFGIQGIMLPLSDILAIPNNLNNNKQIYILDEDFTNKTEYPILSLKYALLKEGSLNCTTNEPIKKASLKYINPNRYRGTPDIIRALTPNLSRSNSATSLNNMANQTFIPIDQTTPSYIADQEDNMDIEESDESDEEISEIMRFGGSKKKKKAKNKRKTKKNKKMK